MPSLLLCQFVMDNRFMGRFLDVEMIQKKLVNPTVVTRPYAVKKNRRLIVSNLHPKMTKKHLIEVFVKTVLYVFLYVSSLNCTNIYIRP